MKWEVVYKKAYNEDGSLFFPEKLTKEFLDNARKIMGSYLFANQYLNEVIPNDEIIFKPSWIKYYESIPENTHTFCFIDPAIGQKDHHDYTAIVVVDVDSDANWYVRVANRYKITPTELIVKLFEVYKEFRPSVIGIEVVAFQEAILDFLDKEMKRRQVTLPVTGIKRNKASKITRIQGLVPLFEWSRIKMVKGLLDLEDEMSMFPRGKFDDLLDALASINDIVFYPSKEKKEIPKPHSPSDPNYERWYIEQLKKGKSPDQIELSSVFKHL